MLKTLCFFVVWILVIRIYFVLRASDFEFEL